MKVSSQPIAVKWSHVFSADRWRNKPLSKARVVNFWVLNWRGTHGNAPHHEKRDYPSDLLSNI